MPIVIPEDAPKRKPGRPRAVDGARSSGKETRLPRKAGGFGGANGARLYPDAISTEATKPVKEMTPEERREYDAARARKSRAEARAAKLGEVLAPEKVRIYAASQAEAEEIGGPDAVAMKRVTVIVPVELWERTRKTAWALRGAPQTGFTDTIGLLEWALEQVNTALEQRYNDGKPFDVAPPDTSPKGPTIPKADAKPRKRRGSSTKEE